jgi:hypothetical protein
MSAIDAAILDVTEWLCRKFQILTGRTNVWLAVQLTNLSVVLYFVWAVAYFRQFRLGIRVAVAIFCAGVLYVLTQTVFKISIDTAEADAYRRVAKGLRNPRRLRDAQLRISFLTLSVLLFCLFLFLYSNFRVPMALLSYPLVLLTTVLLYVLACDPLPPCAGKITVWVRGWTPARLTSPESSVPTKRSRHSRFYSRFDIGVARGFPAPPTRP